MKTAQEYQKRLQRHLDELKWLYCELYPGREDMFTQLCEQMEAWYQDRPESEKKLDREREQEPAWYSRQDMLGMMLYIDAFAGNLKGVKKKLPYQEACNVNYLHLMPFQDLLGKGECVLRNIKLPGNGYGWYYKTWEE